MPHAIDDDEWPDWKRMFRAFMAGRFGKKRPGEDRVGGGGGTPHGVRVGIAKEDIKSGESGEVYFTRATKKQGQEEKGTKHKKMYSHYGLVRAGARVLYARTPGGGYEIIQAPC